MQNKLQELTDKLYNEGLSKGKQEAELLRANAKKEAEKIIADAKNEAANIIASAKKEAEQIKSRVENDLRMASNQTIAAVKQQVENLIISKALSNPVKASMTDAEFLKSVILTTIVYILTKSARITTLLAQLFYRAFFLKTASYCLSAI